MSAVTAAARADVPARAAAVWRHRARVELEAVALFEQLGWSLAGCGYRELAARAFAAADDEERHARRCRALVDALGGDAAGLAAPGPIVLGPPELSARDRVLYAAVAVGCVTESLSCALLLALREAAELPLVAATVDEILKDEIEHARIGWAVLAAEAARRDVSWLGPHVPLMVATAVTDDLSAMAGEPSLAGLGVLPRAQIRALVEETCRSVIGPGLARQGLAPAPR